MKRGSVLLLYFATARLGLALGAVNGVATPIWPPSGISLAALLIFGPRLWPWVALGAFLANYSVGIPIASALGIALGNTLEAFAGAFLLRRAAGLQNSLERLNDVLSLIVLSALLSTMISATLGTTSAWLGGVVPAFHFAKAWWAWWLGDMLGVLVVAPVFLTWSVRSHRPVHLQKIVEGCVLLLLFGGTCQIMFGGALSFIKVPYPRTFLVFPFLIWGSLRFRTRFVSLAVLEVSVIAIWNTLKGHGPFFQENLLESLLLLQGFIVVLAVTSLILAAVVTQRKKADESLRKSEERIRTIIDHAQDAVVVMNGKGLIVSWNPQAETIFGWTREEAIGRKIAETIIPKKFREAHEKGLERFLVRGEGPLMNQRMELTALRRDGSEFPVELTVSPLRSDSEYHFSAFLRDITDRKRAEFTRLYLASLVESSEDAIIGKTLDGFITSWNRGAERLYGYSEKEILAKPISLLLPSDRPDEVAKILERLKRGETVGDFETRRKRKDGTVIDVSLTISPIRDTAGTVLGASAIARDITERKKIEEVLRERTEELEVSNQELEQFAAVVSHDLQEPLLKIIAFGDRLKVKNAAHFDEKGLDYLERIQNAAFRMRQLIDDLLTFSKASRMKRHVEPVSLKTVLQRVLSDLEIRIKQSEAVIEVGALPVVKADLLQMQQLFQNLVSNALKYGKQGEAPYVAIKSRDLKNGFVEIAIEDHGIGFDEKYADRIFEPFERLDREVSRDGTGMGLAICKKIVERHGGKILARSRLGEGSLFIITLPMG